MSVLDNFDAIIEKQVNNPDYQRHLEMLNLIAKYPGEIEGLSQWYVRRWLVYGGLNLKSILSKPNKIYYGIVPIDLYGTFGNMNFDHNKRYFIAALDGETDQTSYIPLTPKEYCEFINLKTDYDNESTR